MARQSIMQVVLALLVIAASAVVAQVVPSSSIDPLNGSSFSTPFFTVSTTYTITTTFPGPGSVTPTVISGGAGPSPATGAYVFTYSAPVSSLAGVDPTEVFSSLAANGLPTEYGAAYQPKQDGLQIVDAATIPTAPLLAVGSMTLASLLAALWIL